jgi:hypothetical protein
MKPSKKMLVGIAISTTGISLFLNLQVRSAQALELQKGLNNYWQQLQAFLSQELEQALNQLNEEIQPVVESAIGKLGIPAPSKVEQKVQEQIQQQIEAGAFGINPTAQAQATVQAVEQAIAKGQIEAQLGKQGQSQIAQEIDSVDRAVSETSNAATIAQSANVTQDVLKQIATQNTQVTAILQAAHQEAVKTRIATLGSNKSLLDISNNLDQQQWEKQVDAAASHASLVNATAQFTTLIESQSSNNAGE